MVGGGALGAVPECHEWDAFIATGTDGPVADAGVRPDDLACFIYTAGTTGPSKGCMLPQNYIVALADQIARAWQRRPDDVVLTPLPLFHFNAISVCVVGTLVVGGSASIARRFSVSRFWPEVKRTGSDVGVAARFVGHPHRRGQRPPGPTRPPPPLVRGGTHPARDRHDLARAVRLSHVQRGLRAHRGVAHLDAAGGRGEPARARPASPTITTSTSVSSTTTTWRSPSVRSGRSSVARRDPT